MGSKGRWRGRINAGILDRVESRMRVSAPFVLGHRGIEGNP